MSYEAELQGRIERAEASRDIQALNTLLAQLYQKADSAPRPFDAAIELRPEIRKKLQDTALEGDAAINWANRIARASRRVAYALKTASGFDGLRIVDEGDSWFQYPLLLEDTIDHLGNDADKAIMSLSAAGDLVDAMAGRREYMQALQDTGARIMLLSGGGNDLLGSGNLSNVLLPYAPGKAPGDLLNEAALAAQVERILNDYRRILDDIGGHFPAVQVFGHAYDLPVPQPGGKWIGAPLEARGIPLDIGREVVGLIVQRFTRDMQTLAAGYGNFTFVDMRGVIGASAQSWHDELHPKSAGYGRVAERFRKAIGDHVARGFTAPPIDIARRMRGPVIVLDPGHGGAPPPGKLGGSSWNNATGPNGTLEKTLTLDIAKRARTMLQARGHDVTLTREGDVNLSLADRAAAAKRRKAAVFVSIHFNASTGHNAQGTETFVHSTRTAPAERLCRAVQAAMVARLGLRDRNAGHPGGVKAGGFGVINPSKHASETAAVLHEVSFLDRADEEARLAGDAYRDGIAAALADGIEAHLGIGNEAAFELAEPGDDIGDAIELEAEIAGMTLHAFLGAAEAPQRHVGGHALPGADAGAGQGGANPGLPEAAIGGSFAQRLTASHLARLAPAPVSGGDGDEASEFAQIDPGPGLILDLGNGGTAAADCDNLERAFANLPADGFDLARFEALIEGLNLRHFLPAEFLYLGASHQGTGRSAGLNSLPPEDLWPNIVASALMLDEIRHQLGAPVRVLSCYRNAAYNRAIGGAAQSLHMRFNAIDWACDSGTPDHWCRIAQQVRASDARFSGGVGRYPGFVHIDTRGHQADW